ncbi:hypothetical protein V6N11_075432 [Hibiscus sabdariffa]|uniref:Cytochrome b5 heme-binding domain-containing protein n=1 Tax=Hibiscus sabdariffa TaxID=183260 RepID=A0ABR2R6Z4_9ROSI
MDSSLFIILIFVDSGGDDVVLAAIGKDATDEFEDAGHSESAKELLQNFCIGELDTSAPIIPELENSSKNETNNYSQNLMELTKQYWAVPVAIAGISVVYNNAFAINSLLYCKPLTEDLYLSIYPLSLQQQELEATAFA